MPVVVEERQGLEELRKSSFFSPLSPSATSSLALAVGRRRQHRKWRVERNMGYKTQAVGDGPRNSIAFKTVVCLRGNYNIKAQ